jgi:hypothetical protein
MKKCLFILACSLVLVPGCSRSSNQAGPGEAQAVPGPEDTGQGSSPADTDPVLSDIVTAKGQGSSEELAIASAFRQAVRQVIGVLIDSQTLIENDELIEDKIIAYSQGYIDSWETISSSDSNGIYSVKIKAVVQRREITRGLEEHIVQVTTSFDGESLFDATQEKLTAEINRKQTREKDFQAKSDLLQQALKDLPKLLRAEVQEPAAEDYDEAGEKMRLVVRFGIDLEEYAVVKKRVIDVLEKIALEKTTELTTMSDLEGHPSGGDFIDYFTCWSERNPAGRLFVFLGQGHGAYHRRFTEPIAEEYKIPNRSSLYHLDAICRSKVQKHGSETWCFWVCHQSKRAKASLRWTGYLLDADLRPLFPLIAEDSHLHEVELVARDGTGEVVTELAFPIWLHSGGGSKIFSPIFMNVLDPTGETHGNWGPHARTDYLGHGMPKDGYMLEQLNKKWEFFKGLSSLQYNVYLSPFVVGQLPTYLQKFPAGNIQVFSDVGVGIEFPIGLETLKDVKSFTAAVTHRVEEGE